MDRTPLLSTMRAGVAAALDGGRTLPASWYRDPEIFGLEREEIFRRTWQYVGSRSKVSTPGAYFTASVEGVPVVVTCTERGEIRAFVNICRHRAHEVATDEGTKRIFQCRYHGWTYDLEGNLRSAPRCTDLSTLDPSPITLKPLRVGQWDNLVFINLDPEAEDFAAEHAELFPTTAEREMTFEGKVPRGELFFEMGCNWKVLVENSCECYHCPTTHPGFRAAYSVDPDTYVIEAYRSFVYHKAPVRTDVDPNGPWGAPERDWEMYHLWPNTLVMTGGTTPVNHVLVKTPVSVDKTQLRVEMWAAPDVPASTLEAEAEAWTTVLSEDCAVVESAQRGLASGLIEDGPLVIDSEFVLVDMQQRLLNWIDELRVRTSNT